MTAGLGRYGCAVVIPFSPDQELKLQYKMLLSKINNALHRGWDGQGHGDIVPFRVQMSHSKMPGRNYVPLLSWVWGPKTCLY